MDFSVSRWWVTFSFLGLTTVAVSPGDSRASSPIQFDLPSIVTAEDTSLPGSRREVTVELGLSTLVVAADSSDRPIDHLLVRIRMRGGVPVVEYSPKTELQSDFAGPISVTDKDEKSDVFGLSADGVAPSFGGAHAGVDQQRKHSKSTQFQEHAPMEAVIAAGTFDRGRGVYFKLRWTAQQVLEGERRFRATFAVPQSWRGGLLDVDVVANRSQRPVLGAEKLRTVAGTQFVVAVCQPNDPEACELAIRLSSLDRKLATLAHRREQDGNPIAAFWNRVLPKNDDQSSPAEWYQLVTMQAVDPYTDKRIQRLPMPIRIAVLDYADTASELDRLDTDHQLAGSG